MEELILEGNKYKGRFLAAEGKNRRWRGSHYSEHLVDTKYWEGKGIITDKETNEERSFLFKTEEKDYSCDGLEDEIMDLKRWPSYDIPKIIRKEKIVDLILQSMYEDTKNRKDEEIIPTVYPPTLKMEELVEKGLVAEKSGQIRLPLTS